MSTDPHTQRVRGLAHAWLLVRETLGTRGEISWSDMQTECFAGTDRRVWVLSPRCNAYRAAVERYGAGPR